MNDKITVCLGKGGQREMAESFARKNNVSIMDKPGEHLTVMFDSRGVSLTGYGLTYQGDFEGMQVWGRMVSFLQHMAMR